MPEWKVSRWFFSNRFRNSLSYPVALPVFNCLNRCFTFGVYCAFSDFFWIEIYVVYYFLSREPLFWTASSKHLKQGITYSNWLIIFCSLITKPVLEEEAWNAYPYTKTQYTCFQAPSMIKDNLSLSIESKYLNDIGNSENVFNLDSNQLRQRKVYHLDMVNVSYESWSDNSNF